MMLKLAKIYLYVIIEENIRFISILECFKNVIKIIYINLPCILFDFLFISKFYFSIDLIKILHLFLLILKLILTHMAILKKFLCSSLLITFCIFDSLFYLDLLITIVLKIICLLALSLIT